MIDFDVETTGLQPWSGKQHAFLYQFYDGELLEVLRPEKDRERIQWWFNRAKTEGIRAWNAKFDRSFAYVDGFDIPGPGCWRDGMLSAHAINENRSVALKNVATEVLGPQSSDLQKQVKDWLTAERRRRKSEATKNGAELVEPNYSDVPDELIEEYGAEDVILTRKVGDIYDPIIERTADFNNIVEFEHDVMDALWDVERTGFPVDEQGYRRLELELVDNIEGLEERLDNLARIGVEPEDLETFEFNPKSSKQILSALKRRKADLTFVTNDSMDVENLSTVEDELAKAVLDFRAEFKALSTYVQPYINRSYESSLRAWKEPFISPDGRVHANYRQIGTKTGRMSCSDPNLQNQPRDDLRLRYNFRAEPGFKLVTCDLSNVEMRIFAAYAGEGRLLEAIRNGEDIHVLTAEMIGIRDRVRPGGFVESARQRGKTFNFSKVYGGGIRTIRKQLRCTQDEARMYNQRYSDAYPEVTRLTNRIEWKLQDQGYINSAWGRRFRVDPRDAYKAANYLVQGTAADVLKAALVRLHKEGVPIVGCVHDELIAHVPESDAKDARQHIIEALTEHPRITDKVPLEADGVIVNRWSDAKPLKDDKGRQYLFVPEWDRSDDYTPTYVG